MSILSCFLSVRIRKPSDTAISDLDHGPDAGDLTIR